MKSAFLIHMVLFQLVFKSQDMKSSFVINMVLYSNSFLNQPNLFSLLWFERPLQIKGIKALVRIDVFSIRESLKERARAEIRPVVGPVEPQHELD